MVHDVLARGMVRLMHSLRYRRAAPAAGIALAGIVLYWLVSAMALHAAEPLVPRAGKPVQGADAPTAPASRENEVVLSQSQRRAVTVQTVDRRSFTPQLMLPGSVDFREERNVAVYPPYPGRIARLYVETGDPVAPGQILYSVESPDFIQAQSTLISAAAARVQADSALQRARHLRAAGEIDQNDFETIATGQATAEAALGAARRAIILFGVLDSEVNALIARREVEKSLAVRSPIAGRISMRTAGPGAFVQPGNAPAPISVTDVSSVWLLADVSESDAPMVLRGQPFTATLQALPGRAFRGRIGAVAPFVDPNTHKVTIRSQVENPDAALLPGMLADVVVSTGPPVSSPAVPASAVVREGDGTYSAWLTRDGLHFVRRIIVTGARSDGVVQILKGLSVGDRVASDGAIFLSNIAFGDAS